MTANGFAEPNLFEMTEEQALGKLAAMCSTAEHCRSDITDKLLKWGIGDDARARIMQRLEEERYVDDMRYCRAYVKDKVKFDRWGRIKIEHALALKHIDRDLYTAVLDDVADSDYTDALRPLIESKRRTVKARNAYELNGKLMRFAMQRGYTMDIIRRCIGTDGCDEPSDCEP